MDRIKELQENLAIDLVKLEESDIDEKTLKEIQAVYQSVYDAISKVDQQKD